MAESGLSIGYADLCAEVGFFLGYGRTSGSWSASQESEIDGYIQSGVRQVYYPPSTIPEMAGYEWSFLCPTTTLSIVSGTDDYDLPDALGRVVSSFYYPSAEYRAPIQQVPVGRLLAMRAESDLTGPPKYFATRFKAEDRTEGSRQEVLFFPEPDDAWTLSYEYEAYSGPLSDSYPYPLGGMKLSELLIESCLSVAEVRAREQPGVHTAAFQALLIDQIQRDRKQGSANYGQMGDTSGCALDFKRGYSGTTYGITYHGVTV